LGDKQDVADETQQNVIAKMNDATLLEDWGNRVGRAFNRIFFSPAAQRLVSPAT